MLRIDTNVEETQAQVELGHTELLKYFQVGQSNSFETILEIFSSHPVSLLWLHYFEGGLNGKRCVQGKEVC